MESVCQDIVRVENNHEQKSHALEEKDVYAIVIRETCTEVERGLSVQHKDIIRCSFGIVMFESATQPRRRPQSQCHV